MNALATLSPLEQAYDQARENFEHIVGYLDSDEASSMTHSELEKKGRELMRIMLQAHLNNRSPGQCNKPVRGNDGIDRSQVRLQDRKLETVFGTVSIERAGYGKKGVESLHPMDAELNLPHERYSLELRRRVAEEAAKNSFDETVESIGKNTGGHVLKRQIEELVRRAAQDFDTFYEMRTANSTVDEQTGSVLVTSVDGKGVVMRMEDLREQTRKAAMERTHKMGTRLSKGEKKNAKRMATVAAVYTIAPFVRQPEDLVAENNSAHSGPPRPRPEHKRVWASIEKTPEEVIEELLPEARYRDPADEKSWVEHRLLEILRGKAGFVAGGIRRSATLRALSSKQREPIDACARYLLNHSPYLHYDRYLSQGFPIATGVIEGACRHLVKDRMEVTGARWSLAGAEAVLRLRALRSSYDFDEYWIFHEAKEYERNHRTLYTDGIVPPTIKLRPSRKHNHLKAIK